MEYIICCIVGIALVLVILPTLQTIGEIIFTIGEVIKTKLSTSIARSTLEISEIQAQLEARDASCIGFQYGDCEEETEDDEEMKKRNVGFRG